ncbi:MAG: dodecin family protein [Bacteroidota bacterium]
MAIAKVIEVIAEGDTIEQAIQNGLAEASKTIRSIRHIYVEGIQALVSDDAITTFRVNAKVTFVVDDGA